MINSSVSSKENITLTKWLKDMRVKKGHTMRSLGELIQKPHSFIGKIENQERRLDVVEFIRYCGALDVDPTEGLNLIK